MNDLTYGFAGCVGFLLGIAFGFIVGRVCEQRSAAIATGSVALHSGDDKTYG